MATSTKVRITTGTHVNTEKALATSSSQTSSHNYIPSTVDESPWHVGTCYADQAGMRTDPETLVYHETGHRPEAT